MRILVACEESQAVTIELRRLGHEAYSCDIEPCSGGHPEWHLQDNVLMYLNGKASQLLTLFQTADGEYHPLPEKWDMIIAFPPCTKTSNAGAKHLWKGHRLNIPRYYDGLCGKALFTAILNADCPLIAIENPVPSAIFEFPKATQAVDPYYFGDPRKKKTLLWLKGLNPLVADNIVEPTAECHSAGTWFMKGGKERQKNRAKLSHGIARAMAEQWAGPCKEGL